MFHWNEEATADDGVRLRDILADLAQDVRGALHQQWDDYAAAIRRKLPGLPEDKVRECALLLVRKRQARLMRGEGDMINERTATAMREAEEWRADVSVLTLLHGECGGILRDLRQFLESRPEGDSSPALVKLKQVTRLLEELIENTGRAPSLCREARFQALRDEFGQLEDTDYDRLSPPDQAALLDGMERLLAPLRPVIQAAEDAS